MTREELLRALIAQIDLLMHDKDYRFVESEDTWYSRESCKVLTNQEVYDEICAEFRDLQQNMADADCIISDFEKQEAKNEKLKKQLALTEKAFDLMSIVLCTGARDDLKKQIRQFTLRKQVKEFFLQQAEKEMENE